MNKTDVIAKVSEKSGVSSDICEKIIKAFQQQAGDALVNKFKGVGNNRADILAGISEKTGLSLEDCEKVMTAFDETVDTGLTNKLKFFK